MLPIDIRQDIQNPDDLMAFVESVVKRVSGQRLNRFESLFQEAVWRRLQQGEQRFHKPADAFDVSVGECGCQKRDRLHIVKVAKPVRELNWVLCALEKIGRRTPIVAHVLIVQSIENRLEVSLGHRTSFPHAFIKART